MGLASMVSRTDNRHSSRARLTDALLPHRMGRERQRSCLSWGGLASAACLPWFKEFRLKARRRMRMTLILKAKTRPALRGICCCHVRLPWCYCLFHQGRPCQGQYYAHIRRLSDCPVLHRSPQTHAHQCAVRVQRFLALCPIYSELLKDRLVLRLPRPSDQYCPP
jgi:hypothetical protein